MEIRIINDHKEWTDFIDRAEVISFLQTWEWGEFQKATDNEIVRLGLYDDKELCAIALVEKIKAKRGSFLFIPHGPIIKTHHSAINIRDVVRTFRDFLTAIAKKEGFAFIRIAPTIEDSISNRSLFKDLGFKKAPIYMHAERMWVLDIDHNEQTLLQNMRKTTRYLVKRAERDNVIIEKRTDNKAVDDFWKIYKETAKREKFVPFSKEFIKHEFEAFHESGNALFLFGKVGKDYLASALIVFTKSCGFYHQGASIHTKFPVPYRLQWEAILESKKRMCRQYNFWGILQEKRTPKNWGGLTMFKTGFGGRQMDYVPTQDFIISPKYYATHLYELYLRWRRGV